MGGGNLLRYLMTEISVKLCSKSNLLVSLFFKSLFIDFKNDLVIRNLTGLMLSSSILLLIQSQVGVLHE